MHLMSKISQKKRDIVHRLKKIADLLVSHSFLSVGIFFRECRPAKLPELHKYQVTSACQSH